MTTDPTRIFQDGKLKPGIYKIQNLRSETYLDVLQHSKEVCCRPARDPGDRKGLVRPYICYLLFVYLTLRSGKSRLLELDTRCRG